MYGNTFTRSIRAMRILASRPRDTVRWIKNRLDGKSALDLRVPWISWPCIDFLRRHVKPGMKVFEWGGGGSTIFFCASGCEVHTVESNDHWIEQIHAHLDRLDSPARKKCTVQTIPAESRKPADIDAYTHAIEPTSEWDVVLVDGLETDYVSRVACIKAAVGHVKPGGILVLDDAWRSEYAEVPTLLAGYRRHEFWGVGPARWGVTKTDVYQSPIA